MKKKITFETPALYGDHHVQEARRLLLELPGVEDVYASSAFRAVEVTYDPDKVEEKEITKKLDEAGYLGEWELPVEADAATYLERDRSRSYFRHTEVYEASRQVVSFSQTVNYSGRPLWHCPGFGVIKSKMEE
ncbi:MAG: heavy-metal-associated domain-containing protein [Anaerolineales bacterium]|nr:heavy-metal-associated domain-containing protein [Anaerolineales bacterium]